jgi:hypothetical protein
MATNSRDRISLSELSRDRWREPPEPLPHPAELKPAARARRSGLDEFAPLAGMWSWLNEQAPLARMRLWLDERAPLARTWSSFAELAPLTFARYLIAFFIGVIATVVWQSSGTQEETLATAPGALVAMRQSIDKLAAEVTRIRAVEQDILERISAPQPVGAPARSPAQRSR